MSLIWPKPGNWFRSTGSYEPDRLPAPEAGNTSPGFDPQALTSLTGFRFDSGCTALRFDPQALTSLTRGLINLRQPAGGFDPQALTSLTELLTTPEYEFSVSIHRLLRA